MGSPETFGQVGESGPDGEVHEGLPVQPALHFKQVRRKRGQQKACDKHAETGPSCLENICHGGRDRPPLLRTP